METPVIEQKRNVTGVIREQILLLRTGKGNEQTYNANKALLVEDKTLSFQI